MATRPASLLANSFKLRFHFSRLETLEALHFFAPLRLLRFFALLPPLARCMATLRMLRLPAHALYSTWERRDVRRLGFFEPEVVRTLEALCDLVKHLFVLEEFAIGVCANFSPGRCRRWGIWVFDGRGLLVGRYATCGAIDPAAM